MPSLRQLHECVLAFMEDYPGTLVTVVVDATFGHRIDPKEVAEFDAAVENNELVTPPAGAIGRGDAFVLLIAKKAKAMILSNDSFQEFHGEQPWLFEEGRLMGGKPVPHVGWVFVPRSPVRGMISRRVTRTPKSDAKPFKRLPAVSADQPMPVPSTPPPGYRAAEPDIVPAVVALIEPIVAPEPVRAERGGRGRGRSRETRPSGSTDDAAPSTSDVTETAPAPAPAQPAVVTANETLPFLSFVESHPLGTTISVTFVSYSSHGAYATTADGVHIYVPMRMMARPAPRKAREVVALGDVRDVVVFGYNPARRGIDAAFLGFEPEVAAESAAAEAAAVIVPAVPAKAPAAPKTPRQAKGPARSNPPIEDEIVSARSRSRRTSRDKAAVAETTDVAAASDRSSDIVAVTTAADSAGQSTGTVDATVAPSARRRGATSAPTAPTAPTSAPVAAADLSPTTALDPAGDVAVAPPADKAATDAASAKSGRAETKPPKTSKAPRVKADKIEGAKPAKSTKAKTALPEAAALTVPVSSAPTVVVALAEAAKPAPNVKSARAKAKSAPTASVAEPAKVKPAGKAKPAAKVTPVPEATKSKPAAKANLAAVVAEAAKPKPAAKAKAPAKSKPVAAEG